jgi:23S rRNA (adenine1618-N6)-methyltransferase
MEPARNLYKNDIDFAALALQSRDFAKQYVSFTGPPGMAVRTDIQAA